jgi:hypothetical protein
MIKFFTFILVIAAGTATISAQTKPVPTPQRALTQQEPVVDNKKGAVIGRAYVNEYFGFEITLPDTWLIPGDDFEEYMKGKGYDLSLKAPESLSATSKARVNAGLEKVSILVTAYRSMPGSTDNAIMRVSAEDLSGEPQIKDAVDYIDAIRATYQLMKLPIDFRYSETNAEKLGKMQFGYIDTSSLAGKKRMYATVRSRHAILFTLSYSNDDDLATMRQILSDGTFDLKTH